METKMDIYEYINSPDIAAYCREINKTWTPFEMAVIISRSERPMIEKHAAWRQLITDYPDMATPKNTHFDSFDSLHEILSEVIAYEEHAFALFMKPNTGAVYGYRMKRYGDYQYSNSVFTSFEKAWADAKDDLERSEASTINVSKIFPDDGGWIEAYFDYDGNLRYSPDIIGFDEQTRADLFSGVNFDDDYLMMFDDLFYIDIPLPFQLGDILTIRDECPGEKDSIFILKPLSEADRERHERCINGEYCDGSDMISWGFFVSDEGVLFGDHTGTFDCIEYYRGKLTGNDRLLHYVSLYLKGEIPLPELLTMQSRIMLEHQLKNNVRIDMHGVFISESLLAENRLTQEEKKEIEETNGLMPWVEGKLSIHQVEFLVREFGGDNERVQNGLADGGGWYLGLCAGIVHDENHYEKTADSRFNPARRDMARMFLRAYGHTEDGWVDRRPNYSRLPS